jgi:hypothetical protein
MIDGKMFYDRRMKPIQEWVDKYLADNGLSIKGKTDYEKTAIIKHVIEGGRFDEFINLWRPRFIFTTDDCVPIAEATHFISMSLDVESCAIVHCVVAKAHAVNAYWDSAMGAVRFIDGNIAGGGVWNVFVDELDEAGYKLD